MEESRVAADLKKALCERRTIVFIDESGLSERSHRVRTWAPRGRTSVLQHHFNWKALSAAAGITWWNFYFRLYPGAIHATEVVDFLGHLPRHLAGKLLVVWDGLPQHRARLVTEFIRAQRGAGRRSSACRPTRRNSIRWNTSGATGNITSCPTSARAISASSAIRRAARCGACAAAHPWCDPSGGKQNWHYDMQGSISCEDLALEETAATLSRTSSPNFPFTHRSEGIQGHWRGDWDSTNTSKRTIRDLDRQFNSDLGRSETEKAHCAAGTERSMSQPIRPDSSCRSNGRLWGSDNRTFVRSSARNNPIPLCGSQTTTGH